MTASSLCQHPNCGAALARSPQFIAGWPVSATSMADIHRIADGGGKLPTAARVLVQSLSGGQRGSSEAVQLRPAGGWLRTPCPARGIQPSAWQQISPSRRREVAGQIRTGR